jgi:predicted Zn-dependent protease with MMP-like domain
MGRKSDRAAPEPDRRETKSATTLARMATTRPRRRRDRHGRGPRGPLIPRELPGWRSRADQFDEHVLDAVALLGKRWSRELNAVEFAVENVPPTDVAPWESPAVPLGRLVPADGSTPPRIVLFRRPIENRVSGSRELGALVHDVVVEQVASLLSLAPEDVDPAYGEDL